MIHNLRHIYLVLIATVVLSSCKTVFEYPEEPVIDPTLINLDLSVDVDFSEQLYYEPYYKSSDNGYLARTIIDVYSSKDLSEPLFRDTHYSVFSTTGTVDIDVIYQLNALEYSIAIWTDIVDSEQKEDLFFTTESLTAISNIEPYVGNSDLKNSFRDLIEVDLTGYRDQWGVTHYCVANMTRPLARFEIITNDLLLFTAEQSKTSPENQFDVSSYSVLLTYDGYMPFGYNIFTDAPNEARQSISFSSKFEVLSDSTVRLAYDHILVDNTESKVNVSLAVYDANGEVVAGKNDISIPLMRDMNTILVDDYLSGDYSPGIGIDPGFEGDINITID